MKKKINIGLLPSIVFGLIVTIVILLIDNAIIYVYNPGYIEVIFLLPGLMGGFVAAYCTNNKPIVGSLIVGLILFVTAVVISFITPSEIWLGVYIFVLINILTSLIGGLIYLGIKKFIK